MGTLCLVNGNTLIFWLFTTAYRTEEGKPWVLPVVKVAEVAMVSDPTLNHEYLPVAGLEDFREASCKLLLGADNPAIVENRVSY